MMVMLVLAAAILTQAPLLPAPDSQRWETLPGDPAAPLAIAPASVTRRGDRVTFLARTQSAVRYSSDPLVSIMRMTIDCRARSIVIEATDAYEPIGAGELVSSDIPVSLALSAMSDGPALAARLCGGAR